MQTHRQTHTKIHRNVIILACFPHFRNESWLKFNVVILALKLALKVSKTLSQILTLGDAVKDKERRF